MSLAEENKRISGPWLQVVRSVCRRDWSSAATQLETANLHTTVAGKSLSRLVTSRLMRQAVDDWQIRGYFSAWNKIVLATRIAPRNMDRILREKKNELVESAVNDADKNLQAGRVNVTLDILKGLANLNILDWRADRIASSALLIHQGDEMLRSGQFQQAIKKFQLATRQRPDLHYLSAKIANIEGDLKKQKTTKACVLAAPLNQDSRHFFTDSNTGDSNHLVLVEGNKPNSASANQMMWIDGVGAYLLCAGAENWIGKHVEGTRCQIAFHGDLSRFHAKITQRDGRFYISSKSATKLFRQKRLVPTVDASPLCDQDLLVFASGIKMCFHQSDGHGTAKLTLESGHKTVPRCDCIFLVSEGIMIADSSDADIRFPGLIGKLEIKKHGGCYVAETHGMELVADGRVVRGPTRLEPDSRIIGHQLSIQMERIGLGLDS